MKNELLILWTNDNIGTAMNMVFMYAENAMLNGWWNDVTVLIWGASSKLSSENEEIKNQIKVLKENNIRVIACKQCALNYDVVDKLEEQDIEVFFTGEFLSDWIKKDKKLITI